MLCDPGQVRCLSGPLEVVQQRALDAHTDRVVAHHVLDHGWEVERTPLRPVPTPPGAAVRRPCCIGCNRGCTQTTVPIVPDGTDPNPAVGGTRGPSRRATRTGRSHPP